MKPIFLSLFLMATVAPVICYGAERDNVESKPASERVVKEKTQRCFPARNVGIAESVEHYEASCADDGIAASNKGKLGWVPAFDPVATEIHKAD